MASPSNWSGCNPLKVEIMSSILIEANLFIKDKEIKIESQF